MPARPIPGAHPYRFRFTLDDDGETLVIHLPKLGDPKASLDIVNVLREMRGGGETDPPVNPARVVWAGSKKEKSYARTTARTISLRLH